MKKLAMIGMGLTAALVVLPSTLILAVGLVPTAVAALVDHHPERAGTITVGSVNLAGALVVLMELWAGGHSLSLAGHLLAEPINWVIMYGAAGLGAGILNSVPSVFASFAVIRLKAQVAQLRRLQSDLVTEWGESVGGGQADPAPAAGESMPAADPVAAARLAS